MNDYWQTIIKILEKQDYNFSVEDLLDAIWITPYLKSVSWDSRASTDSFADISQILQKIQTDSMLKEATGEKREKGTSKDEELQEEISSREGEELEESDLRDADLYLPKSTSINGTDIGSKIFRIPAAPILSDALQLSRALRLFMQRIPSKINYSIDEEKTAHRIAEEGIWTPTLVPFRERWFEVELIVDAGTSMNVWHGIGYEFLNLLRWMGAFRNIRAWGITTDDPQPRLYAGLRHPRISSQERSPSELTNTNGRKLILVLTDCVSQAWHSGGMLEFLNLWASKGPAAIIQVFPFHLWSRTALHSFDTVSFFTSSPALPSIRLPYEFLYTIPEPGENNEKTGLPVPVVSIDPVSITNWTRLVTGVSGDEVLGCIFRQKDEEFPVGQKTASKLPPEKCIEFFWQLSSPTAIRLALLISASPAISLQIMRIIRNAMLPEATHVHEAEVLLAGLLKPTTQIDEHNFKPGDVQYEFRGEIRWKLLENLPISESIKVLDVVSDYIEEHIGNIRNFRALLLDPSKAEGTLSIGDHPIARVTGEILQSFGGDYARLVRRKLRKIKRRERRLADEKLLPKESESDKVLKEPKNEKKPYLHISRRAREIQESPIRKLAGIANETRKKGIHVYHLNLGQPDIHTPRAFYKNINQFADKVLPYGPSDGLPELKEAMIDYFSRYDIHLKPGNIVITFGGSEAISFTFGVIGDAEDEIIVPEPFYTHYNGLASFSDLKLVPVTTLAETGFHLPSIDEFEKKITSKTKGILISSPNNPTGTVFSEDEIKQLGELVKKYDLFLVANEEYRDFIYDGEKHCSILELDSLEDRAIVVDSISARYSACGARIGAVISRNQEVMQSVLKFAQARSCPPILEQIGAIGAYRLPIDYFKGVLSEYQKRRDILFEILTSNQEIVLQKPKGAFHILAKLPVDDSDNFSKWMLRDFNVNGETVMVAPGTGFYITPGKGKQEVRICYVLETAKLETAGKILLLGIEAYNS